MNPDREDWHRVADLALAAFSATETPPWRAELAWEVYRAAAWHLQYDFSLGNPGDRETYLMAWPRAYEIEICRPALAALPDSVKAAHPAEVVLAQNLATHVDLAGMSTSARLESLVALERTLARLQRLRRRGKRRRPGRSGRR
jgi:hypothetical protein